MWMHASVKTGLSASTRIRVGFGTSLADFDHDGWPDLFVLNGNPIYTTAESPFTQVPQLFRNLNGKRFVEISDQGGPYFRELHSGRGSAAGDLDNDGDLDLVTVLMNEPIRLLRNRNAVQNYIRVRLSARDGDRDAVGAVVISQFNGRSRSQFIVHGDSFFSESDSRLVIPVDPEATITSVTVKWPGRRTERFPNLKAGDTHVLVEGNGVTTNDLQ
jgi:hypothetical protein